MSKKMLTFEIDPDENTLEIHANEQGLIYLIGVLEKISNLKRQEHEHLMTPNWGGEELTQEKQCETNILINHVKLFKWN